MEGSARDEERLEKRRAARRAYYVANREHLLAKGKERHWAKREELLVQMRARNKKYRESGQAKAYRDAHPEMIRESTRKTFAKNKDKYNEQRRERRKRDPTVAQMYRASVTKWKETNRDEWRKRKREEQSKRRAKEKGEKVDYDAVYLRDNGICYLCGLGVTREEAQFDHVIPIAMGGSSAVDNLQILCGPCNRRKGAALTLN